MGLADLTPPERRHPLRRRVFPPPRAIPRRTQFFNFFTEKYHPNRGASFFIMPSPPEPDPRHSGLLT